MDALNTIKTSSGDFNQANFFSFMRSNKIVTSFLQKFKPTNKIIILSKNYLIEMKAQQKYNLFIIFRLLQFNFVNIINQNKTQRKIMKSLRK